MEWTKLDRYDYKILPGVINVKLVGRNDPDLVDIMSEIDRSDGKIFVEGKRFRYDHKYQILGRGRNCSIDIYVTPM